MKMSVLFVFLGLLVAWRSYVSMKPEPIYRPSAKDLQDFVASGAGMLLGVATFLTGVITLIEK